MLRILDCSEIHLADYVSSVTLPTQKAQTLRFGELWPTRSAMHVSMSGFSIVSDVSAPSEDAGVEIQDVTEFRIWLAVVNNVEAFLSESIIASAIDAAKDFFALPEDDKLAVRLALQSSVSCKLY
jgi:hypothetical protein